LTIKPLILAQQFQQLLRSDKVINQAELARIHFITSTRVIQIMNLLKLPLDVRIQIVQIPPDELEKFSETKLRKMVRLQYASKQPETFGKLKFKFYG
jgi:hypothetical protein